MTKNRRILVTIITILLCVSGSAAQEFTDPLARRVTSFLPTYTPFNRPEPADRYFPDDVGKNVADAIIDAYLDDFSAIKQRTYELWQHDARLAAANQPITGVTAQIQALTQNQAAFDTASSLSLAKELNAHPDELLARADQIIAEEKRGRFGRLFNWALSTVDVASLLLGAPRSPNPYSAQGVVSEWRGNDSPSPRERKALALYREFLRLVPNDPRAAEVEKKAEEIDTRRTKSLLEEELTHAQTAYEEQEYWRANFHYQLALMIDEESAEAYEGLAEVERQLQHSNDLESAKPRDPLAGIKNAQWEHNKETLKYVFPGSGFVKDNFVVAGIQVTTEGLIGAATFGALTMVQTATKVFRVFFSNAISQEGVIAEAEKYVHETPPEKRAPEVYTILARAYEKEGRLDKAISYYQLAGEDDEVPRLQQQAGDALLEMAKESPHQMQKEEYLRALVEEYGTTKAASKGRVQLRSLQRPENRGLQLTKAFLDENQDLVGPQGLALKRELFDGKDANVELHEEGITVLPGGKIALRVQSEHGPRTKIYWVPEVSWQRFWWRLRELGYSEATDNGDQKLARLTQGADIADITLKSEREKHSENGWRLLPRISGSVSGSSLDVRGTLPKDLAGTPLTFGNDQHSTYVGLEVPLPFVPVDFLFLGRNGAPSLYPHIRLPQHDMKDELLYR